MPMERLETQIPATPAAPQLIRGWLRTTLATWQLDGFGEVTELLATELVSNVVKHVGRPMTVRIMRQQGSIRVEIDDPGDDVPVLEHPDSRTEHGRGVLVVDALADEWGTKVHPDGGKTVWFELDVATGHAEAHDTDD